jgi:hypothetical protein
MTRCRGASRNPAGGEAQPATGGPRPRGRPAPASGELIAALDGVLSAIDDLAHSDPSLQMRSNRGALPWATVRASRKRSRRSAQLTLKRRPVGGRLVLAVRREPSDALVIYLVPALCPGGRGTSAGN